MWCSRALGFRCAWWRGLTRLPTHEAVLDWLSDRLARRGRGMATAVGDRRRSWASGAAGGRRPCDDEVARCFGRFAASVHSLSAFQVELQAFVDHLEARSGRADLNPEALATADRPAIREVYPNALQVLTLRSRPATRPDEVRP